MRRYCGTLLIVVSILTAAVPCDSQPARARFTPVSDATLLDPDPADWLHWRRTLDTWGYSPLSEINRENVHTLQLKWSRKMRRTGRLGTPLVYAGVMYVPQPRGVVHAVGDNV